MSDSIPYKHKLTTYENYTKEDPNDCSINMACKNLAWLKISKKELSMQEHLLQKQRKIVPLQYFYIYNLISLEHKKLSRDQFNLKDDMVERM